MAELTTTPATGAQGATSSPQSSSAGDFGGGQASSIQPGTATDSLLRSQGGIPLSETALPSVNLDATTTKTTTAATTTPAEVHHYNPVLFGFSALMILIALVLFWSTGRSVKKTTK